MIDALDADGIAMMPDIADKLGTARRCVLEYMLHRARALRFARARGPRRRAQSAAGTRISKFHQVVENHIHFNIIMYELRPLLNPSLLLFAARGHTRLTEVIRRALQSRLHAMVARRRLRSVLSALQRNEAGGDPCTRYVKEEPARCLRMEPMPTLHSTACVFDH
jgi:hypothetical protein